MIRKFSPLTEVDIHAFDEFNNQLKEILERLDANTLFDDDFYSKILLMN